MFVVPVSGDKLKIADNDTPFVVTSYTNLKQEPAVYVDASEGENNIVYFYDIIEINDVKVELNRSSKTFESLGILKRKFNLPQPGDVLSVTRKTPDGEMEDAQVTVKAIKLHNKTEGISRGLSVVGDESSYDLLSIKDIERKNGSEKFDPKKFQKYYFDYLPYGKKSSK
jgi:hypothetical protein